ncbi:hypothetical protein HPB49_023965 [Dermacentor silvarum]|uniref:Uncharacterized protein n=1 Tax=Dermacentor silvarum TaxID=543639 RepID=A0ACB8D921_DERSI|nr:hypothetical protein HPB49_023965 [Dermacentor silvarum]
MDEEAAMELLQDQLEEKNFTPVHVVRRHVSPQTIIMRLGTKLNLAKYPMYQVTNAIGVAAGLTASEVRDVNIQVRQLQNLVAATSGRESATQKLAGLRSMTLDGERHDVTAYVAAEAQHARCVVHGLPKDIPDDQLLSIISIEDRHILAARRLGQSETILLTVKGATVPKEVKMGLWLTKTQPFRPRAVQCTICFTDWTPRRSHECEVRCFNCEGPHGARDPRCPKKQQADKLTRLAAERRRLKTTSKDSGQPKNRQTSQSIATNPPKKNDQNYPSLPLHNRFEALRDTTPDPKSEPRPRSGSLPGYPTKRSTPPPPPPKPKTPSFVRALLSQKPPAHSEEPPQKQPRHSSPEKLEKSDLLWTGDFNSRHAYWGYPDSSAAGRILLDLAHTHQLSLLNDISTPTRTGNSVQRDTNPDLAWGRTRKTPDWRNLGETFGSDHCILEITVPLPNRQRSPKRGYYSIATELTDWDAFRKRLLLGSLRATPCSLAATALEPNPEEQHCFEAITRNPLTYSK